MILIKIKDFNFYLQQQWVNFIGYKWKYCKKAEGKNKDYFENLSVFDYDLDKNYRYIFQSGNNLKMYNSDFKIVKGFKKNKLNYGLKDPKTFKNFK